MQHTLAFAPTEEDLQDFFFDLPVISLVPLDVPAPADMADAEPQQVAAT